MLLHYPPPGKNGCQHDTSATLMTTSRVNLKLIIIVLVVYAVREAHSTIQGFSLEKRDLKLFSWSARV